MADEQLRFLLEEAGRKNEDAVEVAVDYCQTKYPRFGPLGVAGISFYLFLLAVGEQVAEEWTMANLREANEEIDGIPLFVLDRIRVGARDVIEKWKERETTNVKSLRLKYRK